MKKQLVLIGICGIVAAGLGIAGWWLRLPVEPVMVVVPENASTREIGTRLKNAGVISSRFLFVQLGRVTGKSGRLKAGAYLISPRSGSLSILDMLAAGRTASGRITVPEGFSAQQIADLLDSSGIADGRRFLALVSARGLEGYLFPNTYYFYPGMDAEEIVGRMTDDFRKHFTPAMAERARELNMSEREIVTLASIIEREAVRAEERPLIAGVFYNRLRKRWYLESCATVQYALGSHKQRLSLKDLKTSSAYNTYRHRGLPPGPICNPGAASIRAALYPADTQDMFFVASGSGTHVFSRYFKEHVQNKKVVRKQQRASR